MLNGFADNIKIMIFNLYWLLFLKKHFQQSFEIVVNNKYSLEEFNKSLHETEKFIISRALFNN